jgi:iron complex outermembrane receptor protein
MKPATLHRSALDTRRDESMKIKHCVRIKHCAYLIGGAIGLWFASAAGAQQSSPGPETDSDQLSEIVVSATRRDEALQAVPLSITAVSAGDLANIGATQARDLVEIAPNLSEQGSFGRTDPSFFIRGVGSTQFNPNSNSKVGVYLDDVYLNSPAVQGSQLFDIDQVEIARGPQGTLFGQNTTGGMVRSITNKPTIGGGFSADTSVTAGSYDELDSQAAVGFDTGATSAARVAFIDENRDGTQYNTFLGGRDGRTDALAWRAQWLWKPTSDFDLLISAHGSRDRSDLTSYKQLGLINPATGGACPAPTLGSRCTDILGYADTANYHQGEWDIPRQNDWVDSFGSSVTLNWMSPAFTLTSVAAYEQNTSRILEDTSASPNDFLTGSYYGHPRQFSEEIRLTSPEQQLQWIAGIYYFHEDLDSSVSFAAPGLGPSAFTGSSGELEGVGQVSSMTTNSYAGFGNIDFAATSRLKLTLGLRFTHETKNVQYDAFIDDVSNFVPLAFAGSAEIVNDALVQTIDFSADKAWNNVSGRAAADYAITEGVMAYASIARGFNSGNYNGGAFGSPAEATLVNPETLTSYELGLKTEFGKNFRFNIDGFYYDFKNQQVFVLESGPGGTPFQQLSNAAASSLAGGEAELAWKPITGLFAQIGAGYTYSRFDSFDSPVGGNLTGNTLPSAPKTNLNGLIRYELPVSPGVFAMQLDGKYQSKQFFSVNNDPLLAQDGYTTMNARISYSTLGDRLVVSAWGRNIGNKNYFASAYDLSSYGFDQYIVGDPRTFGVTVRYRTN